MTAHPPDAGTPRIDLPPLAAATLRRWGTRTLVLTGAESSGKTTLAMDLAGHFGVPWVPEYARDYLASHGPSYVAHDVEAIARGQQALERTQRATQGGLLVADTDLLVICIWMRERYGHVPAWIDAALRPAQGRHYVLTSPEMPWEPDPLREHPDPHARARLHALYRDELTRRGLDHLEVSGDRAARVAQVVAWLDRGRG